jgi:CRP-like cAMP-binding protein
MTELHSRSATRNHLLSALSSDDRELLQPHLETVPLALRQVIEQPHEPITNIYFPESGFASVVARDNRGRRTEVGVVGREGMTGTTVVTGNHRSPHETFVQAEGFAQRIGRDELRDTIGRSVSLHGVLLRYVQGFMIQTAHTALANGRSKLEERLARWLLMSQDRVEGKELALTHDFLALMLAVRRAGVTTALHELENRGLIRSKRSSIEVRDREGLIETADGCYGIPEAEMHRLMGSVEPINGLPTRIAVAAQ